MDDILKEFAVESKELIQEMVDILELVEVQPDKYTELEKYGQVVDRIMGGAKVLALDHPPAHMIHTIGNFAELCKLIGYKASQIGSNAQFLTIVVAFLMDATETLQDLNSGLEGGQTKPINELVTQTFLERLRWLAGQFDKNLRASVATGTENKAGDAQLEASTQADIDSLLKQMGLIA